MMTEIQKIILTRLLGPEDPRAFKRTLDAEKARRFRTKNPSYYKEYQNTEECRAIGRASKRKARQDPVFKAYEQVTNRDWVISNPEKSRASQRNSRTAQRKRDPACKISGNLRTRMTAILKGVSKSAPSLELLGCSIEQWRLHLESLFAPGMTWENYGTKGWHIDHKKPCAVFNLSEPEQQRICFHWSNTQPLWATENLKKGDSYNSGK